MVPPGALISFRLARSMDKLGDELMPSVDRLLTLQAEVEMVEKSEDPLQLDRPELPCCLLYSAKNFGKGTPIPLIMSLSDAPVILWM